MIWLREKNRQTTQPQSLTWGARLMLSAMAVLMLAGITAVIKLATDSSWWIVVVHMTLATCGFCFLLMLMAVHVSHPSAARRRQVTIGLMLLIMLGLGMFLAGVGGIFRLAGFDPAKATVPDWAGLIVVLSLLLLFATPVLIVLLDVVVALANVVVRLPAARMVFSGLLWRSKKKK